MMYKIHNNEPVVHQHRCNKARKGAEMTCSELHDFAVEVLMEEYHDSGVELEKIQKLAGNEADFCFVNGNEKVNVFIVYNDDIPTLEIGNIDTSWLLSRYREMGEIPRITFASAWCIDVTKGKPAICGGSFCFKFYSVSPIPDEENISMKERLTPIELAAKYAETWQLLNPAIISPYLNKDFHYKSDWVYDELPSRKEFLDYFIGKLEAIKRTGSKINVSVLRNKFTGQVGLSLFQDMQKASMLLLTTNEGQITSARMTTLTDGFETIDPADELHQGHGDHLDAIMESSELVKSHLVRILQESEYYDKSRTQVITDNINNQLTDVFSLKYDDGDMALLSLVVYNEKGKTNEFASIYPTQKGVNLSVTIDKVREWDNQIEATIECHHKNFEFAFFPTDYYKNKLKYKKWTTLTINVSAIAMKAEEGSHGFCFEGQQAVDYLKKIGQQPQYDEHGNIEPIRFDTSKMVAFLSTNRKSPDEAEFQAPVNKLSIAELLNVQFIKTEIQVCSHDDTNVFLPLYFRKDFIPNVEEGMPVHGWLWVTGSIVEDSK